MSRFLVTGCSGFIGSNLVVNLLNAGHEVVCVGRQGEQPTPFPCISYTFHDLNWKSINPIDAIFHQAAITNTLHSPDSDFYLINTHYTKAFFMEAARNDVSVIVYASSCAVYGNIGHPFVEEGDKNPLNAYGKSKLLLDEWAMSWAKESRVRVVGLRYSNVYGPIENHKGKSSSMIYQLAQQIKSKNRPKLFQYGEQKRDFVYIDDVITANRLALFAPSGVYNVGSGQATSFNQIVTELNGIYKTNLEPEYIENPIKNLFQDYTLCDLTLAQRMGYTPKYDIKSGITKYYKSGHLNL